MGDVLVIDGVEDVPENAFEGNEAVRVLRLSDSVKTLGAQSFAWCANLEIVEMGNGVERIERSAFEHCPKLKTVVWSETLEVIGDNAFMGAGIETLGLPKGLAEIGLYAFSECRQLNAARIPDTVQEVGSNAFQDCIALKDIRLPNNPEFTTLGAHLLDGCVSLKTLIVPKSVNYVEATALNLESLLAVAFLGPEVEFQLNPFQPEPSVRIAVYRNTGRATPPRWGGLEIRGLIEDDGSVTWFKKDRPLGRGIRTADIRDLFPARGPVFAALRGSGVGTFRTGPIGRFLEIFQGSGRVFDAADPGNWGM